MPELPEVETTARGLTPHLTGATLERMQVFDDRLRWPVASTIVSQVRATQVLSIDRRSKYLLFRLGEQTIDCAPATAILKGTLMVHLGMSGRLQLFERNSPREKHSHVQWDFGNGQVLRLTDPRRFGSVHWFAAELADQEHTLLRKLGPEPLTPAFSAQYLFTRSRNRRVATKVLLMNAQVVVGVGNIYASEALFRAKICPTLPAGMLTLEHCKHIVAAIKQTLRLAIKAGGTTLRDFQDSHGNPGYFKQKLMVYDRADQACRQCDQPIAQFTLGQRATYWCPNCQRES